MGELLVYPSNPQESYALEQVERLKSHARAKNVVHTFAWNPLYYDCKSKCEGEK